MLLALVLVPLSAILAFTWAPLATIGLGDAGVQYDLPQKIFYWHVPVALASYLAFAAGAWNGLLYLLRRTDDHDTRSYVGVHVGIVFGTLVLVTGSIWAKAAWGVWWNWGDRQLLVFLTLYLFYGAYFVLRFSIDPGRARATASAIYAVLGVALVPLSFLAIRIADTLIHPIVLTSDGDRLTGEMWGTFAVGSAGFLALAVWMIQLEVAGKLRAARGWVVAEDAPSGAGDLDSAAADDGDRTGATAHV
jgi:heme exporter protein C